jgi:hypothetical protein
VGDMAAGGGAPQGEGREEPLFSLYGLLATRARGALDPDSNFDFDLDGAWLGAMTGFLTGGPGEHRGVLRCMLRSTETLKHRQGPGGRGYCGAWCRAARRGERGGFRVSDRGGVFDGARRGADFFLTFDLWLFLFALHRCWWGRFFAGRL